MSAAATDRKRSQLEAYFIEGKIETRLDSMLNDMVMTRPTQPLRWLASKMHADEASAAGTPAANTMPQLSTAAGKALGAELEGVWAYATGFGATAATGKASAAAAAAAPAKAKAAAAPAKGGALPLVLTIDKIGDEKLLLSIRENVLA